MPLASVRKLPKLNFSKIDEFPVFFCKLSTTKTMLRVFILVFAHTIMKVSKVRDHIFVCSVKISQIMTIMLYSLPMRNTMHGAIKKSRLFS